MQNLFLITLLLLACSGTDENPKKQMNTGDDNEETPVIIGEPDPNQPFRFPLDNYTVLQPFAKFNTRFAKYHSADDLQASAGTAVYASGNGEIIFSGPLSGYGWLIVIEHSDYGVYSLYGHLSTRRDHRGTGTVNKGDLIAYIGDDDEDGSGPMDNSGTYPYWAPHLHFAIRTGKKTDYPSTGDDRWMAGYTDAHPKAIGWLAPGQYVVDTK
ncbi:MAG: M23 family metallopeptidase [Calditrichaeota bacterium]|nr:M23 family metallopeptidase [Calditrichota bacterium]